MSNENEQLKQLEELLRTQDRSLSAGDVCRHYRRIEPYLAILVGMLEKQKSRWARLAVMVIQYLLPLAEVACPSEPAPRGNLRSRPIK